MSQAHEKSKEQKEKDHKEDKEREHHKEKEHHKDHKDHKDKEHKDQKDHKEKEHKDHKDKEHKEHHKEKEKEHHEKHDHEKEHEGHGSGDPGGAEAHAVSLGSGETPMVHFIGTELRPDLAHSTLRREPDLASDEETGGSDAAQRGDLV